MMKFTVAFIVDIFPWSVEINNIPKSLCGKREVHLYSVSVQQKNNEVALMVTTLHASETQSSINHSTVFTSLMNERKLSTSDHV